MKLYIDLDGVLADFDKSAEAILKTDNIYKYEFIWGPDKFWTELNKHPNFFRDLELKHDAGMLLSAVKHLNPAILTALPSTNGERVAVQKTAWVHKKLGLDYPIITCPTKDKPNYCEPGDILIDDRAVNRDAWMAKGGIYIVHTTTSRTVVALEALGII